MRAALMQFNFYNFAINYFSHKGEYNRQQLKRKAFGLHSKHFRGAKSKGNL